MNSWTIKKRLTFIGLVSGAAFIVLSLLFFAFIVKLDHYNVIRESITAVEKDILVLRKEEKDFLARKDVAYQETFHKTYAALVTALDDLQKGLASQGLKQDEVIALKGVLRDYNGHFDHLVAQQVMIGLDPKSGLYGTLRDAIHKAEKIFAQFKQDDLLKMMLTLRRNEKDFMLRSDLKYRDTFKKNMAAMVKAVNGKKTLDAEAKSRSVALLHEYDAAFMKLVQEEVTKGLTPKMGILGEMRETVHKTESILEKLTEELRQEVDEKSTLLTTLLWGSVGVLLLIVVAALVLTGRVLVNRLNAAVEVLGEVVRSTTESAQSVSGASTELAESASSQAAGVEQVSAATEESTASIQQNLHNITEAESQARYASQVTEEGQRNVEALLGAMEGINTASERIAVIIKTIDEIAFQTNLLALNAAVEAARAGEHGLGFAVVAEEVKNLASRSAEAAKETTGIIENAITQVKNGNQLAQQTGDVFEKIFEQNSKNLTTISEITVAAKEQAEGIDQIAQAMSQIDEATQLSVRSSEGLAESARQLDEQSTVLRENIDELGRLVGSVDTSTLSGVKQLSWNAS